MSNGKIYKIVGIVLIVLAVISGICSYFCFFSGEKEDALDRIETEEEFRAEFVRLRSAFRNYGEKYKAQECQEQIDDIDRVVSEQRDIIEAYDTMGTVLAVTCIIGLVTGVIFLCVSVKKRREELLNNATIELENK